MRESYVPNFKVPARRGPSSTMWLTLMLCLVLPPLGLALLWGRTRCPLRGKVWISSVSLIVLVFELTLLLNWREQNSYVAQTVPVAYVYGTTQTPAPETKPAPQEAAPAPGEAETEGEQEPDAIIPGNPMG